MLDSLRDSYVYRYSLLEMTGLIYLAGSGQAGRHLQVSGDLGLVQKQPLSYRGGRDSRYLPSPLPADRPLDLGAVLRDYGARNVSVRLENEYVVWARGTGAESFVLEANLNYPAHTVVYIPGFWHLIKWGWIQYLAILVVFVYLFNTVKNFVFSMQILPTISQYPWKQ